MFDKYPVIYTNDARFEIPKIRHDIFKTSAWNRQLERYRDLAIESVEPIHLALQEKFNAEKRHETRRLGGLESSVKNCLEKERPGGELSPKAESEQIFIRGRDQHSTEWLKDLKSDYPTRLRASVSLVVWSSTT